MRKDGKPLSVPGRVLKTLPDGRGYPRTTVCWNGRTRWAHVHTLVAEAFLGIPPGAMGNGDGWTVNHINGRKTDNRVENLEYLTSRENIAHARRVGLRDDRGAGNGNAKLTDDQVHEIRNRYKRGITRQVDLASEYGVDQGTISRIVRGAGWRHHH
jgi:hypothetical protein